MISITTKKKIIYIDQSFISNLAKAEEKNLEKYKILARLLKQGVSEEKIVCPSSWYHREESSLVNQKFEKSIKNQLGYIGQVDFGIESEIERKQFISSAKQFCGLDAQMLWADIFDKDPDTHLERFKISANLNFKVLDIPEERARNKDSLDKIRIEVLAKAEDFRTRLLLEQQAYKNYLHQNFPGAFLNIFQSNHKKYSTFMNSLELLNMPKFHIYTTMWSSILTGSSSREIQEGDWVDVQAISTYLPYTDIFTTDTFMKHHMIKYSLDKKYNIKIFSPTKEDIVALCKEVEKIIEENPPANVPALSVILIPDEKMKDDYWNVCQKLNNSRMWYKNRMSGGWIELINVDDGKCPRFNYADAKVEIDVAYFMGFDQDKKTKEEALKAAKSNRILLYDHFMPPTEDFIEKVMKCIKANDIKPLGYELIVRS